MSRKLQHGLMGTVQLEDLMGEDKFLSMMTTARLQIIGVFQHARSAPNRGDTPGYVAGLDNEPSSIAEFVQRAMREKAQQRIFSLSDLPAIYQAEPLAVRKLIVGHVRYEIFMRVLLIMRDVEFTLWYYNSEWAMPQSTLDEAKFKAAAWMSYQNWRGWHGRPNAQRRRARRLRMAPGTSIGAMS